MKLKLLLLFLVVVGFSVLSDAQTKPKNVYNNLIITEAKLNRPEFNYAEITNMGAKTINLKEFEFGKVDPWTSVTNGFPRSASNCIMLPDKSLAPGQSYVIAIATDWEPSMWFKNPTKYRERVAKPETYKRADLLLDADEYRGPGTLPDKITTGWAVLGSWGGRDCLFLRHHFIDDDGITKDSMIVDQVNGMFTGTSGTRVDGAPVDVAGVLNATSTCVLIRRHSVTTGITELSSVTANLDAAKLQFTNNKGTDYKDSEWIPVPILGGDNDFSAEPWRALFWTYGNSVNATLDATTLVSKTGKVKVDLAASTISIPWGIRNKDSVMYQFNRKPGLAWKYACAATTQDSAYISARTGDKLTVYACGDVVSFKEFTINVLPATADDNIVVPKNGFNYTRMFYTKTWDSWSGMRVTDGVKGMDTISYVPFATRIDTLYKYLDKAPKASWKIVFANKVEQPDLKKGDILRVTSESGKVKDYFLKLRPYFPSNNAYLGSITWPDMPSYFKGDIAKAYGWAGDTIPGFIASKFDYVVKIPMDYDGIPALVFSKQQFSSKVVALRAKTLSGTAEDRTAKYTVTAESDTIVNTYTVRFEKEKDDANIQQYKAEPFISQFSWNDEWSRNWVEIVNPGTQPLDLSHYMIMCGQGDFPTIFNQNNGVGNYSNAYQKYVPGRKWQSSDNWTVKPRILEPDFAVNAIVYPGDVFVMADHGGGGSWPFYGKEADVNFKTGKNPWGFNMSWGNAVTGWWGATYLCKILNDSIVSGLKPANNIADFELLDAFGQPNGNAWVVAGKTQGQIVGFTRKPELYKGNPVLTASFGTNATDCEWILRDRPYFDAIGIGWPQDIYKINDGLGSHNMNDITVYRSTVSSKLYKVSSGYGKKETIKGLTTGTTVSAFYLNIIKANELQTLKVKSQTKTLAATDAISKGDTLIVLSADKVNTSKYIIDVTANGLSSNDLLTSTKFTVAQSGTTGTISGIAKNTKLKTVFAGVVVPAGASMTITDENDAYMSLVKLNYDTAYVDVIATDKIYFEVLAENGITKVRYQLKPTVIATDAYVTSDLYSVDQFGSLIQFVPAGTSVSTLMNNVTPAAGATMQIFDKAGYVRTMGGIYNDDKLVVTAADGKTIKAYYFSMLNFHVNTYLAYVISDDYQIDQVARTITGPKTATTLGELYGKLYPSFGATMKVLDKSGKESILKDLSLDDQLLVTAADGKTIAIYQIKVDITKVADPLAQSIKMFPNPTSDGRVIVQGLVKGNRVRVFNSAGITLRDVIVENSTNCVSLVAQPAGIYVFVISNGDQHISIQKIVKK